MATINYKFCDRCQEKINYHSRLRAFVQMPRDIKILWIVCGVSMDQQKELCGKCAEELEKFLEKKGESHE